MMIDSAFWRWSKRRQQIDWSTTNSSPLAQIDLQSLSDAVVRTSDGAFCAFRALAESAAVHGEAFVGKIEGGLAPLAFQGGFVFGQKTGRDHSSGIVCARQGAGSETNSGLESALIEAIEALPEAFVLYDANDRLIICSEQYRRLYPSVAELIKPGVYFPELVRQSVERGVFRISGDEENWAERRISFHQAGIGFFEQQLSDGRWIQVSERRTPSGRTTSIRSDITVLKEREQDLRAAHARAEAQTVMRTQFIAKVGHELRNPLNVVFGIAQLLEAEPMPKRQKALINSLLDAARATRDVLNDILDVATVSSGHVDIRCEPAPPRPLIEEIANIGRAMAQRNGLKFRSRISKDLPDLMITDTRRLRQIVLNLLGNAFKYTHSGAVTLGASSHRRGHGNLMLRLTVADSGSGIPKAPHRLFAPYARETVHVAAGIEGFGLGLAISQELADAIGATIGIAPGARRGTRAWVEVPAAGGTEAWRRPSRARSADVASGPPLSVLVVDDEQTNLIVADALLKRLGHEVTTALGGEQGLRALEQRRYEAILLDIAMDDVSGIDLARRIRATEAGDARNAIIAMTGNVMPSDVKTYLAAGFTGFVEKPVCLDDLAAVLAATRDRTSGAGILQPRDRLRFSPRVDTASLFDASRLDRMVIEIGRDKVTAIILSGLTTFHELDRELHETVGDADVLARLLHKARAVAGLFGLKGLADAGARADLDRKGRLSSQGSAGLRAHLADAMIRMKAYAQTLEEPPPPSEGHFLAEDSSL